MAKKPKKAPSEAQLAARKKFGEQAKARAELLKTKTSQTQNDTNLNQNDEEKTQENHQETIPTTEAGTTGSITLTMEQFNKLLDRVSSSTTVDHAASPSFAPGNGLEVNAFGRVIGTVTKFNINPGYYPNPVERLLDEPRFSRFNLRENYFISWDITSKPYETKTGVSTQEPTFHLTLYNNIFDDDGVATGEAIIIQTLHMNEDEELARIFASEEGIEVSDETLRDLMDQTRYARSLSWLENLFFPPKNFQLNVDSREQAIGGRVVTVVTKSNVKGFGNKAPVVTDEELGIA